MIFSATTPFSNPKQWMIWIAKPLPELKAAIDKLTQLALLELHQMRDDSGLPFVFNLVRHRCGFCDDTAEIMALLECKDVDIYRITTNQNESLMLALLGSGQLLGSEHNKEANSFFHNLLDRVDLSVTSISGKSNAAHWAVFCGQLYALEYILEKDPTLDYKNKFGQDCLAIANQYEKDYPAAAGYVKQFQAIKIAIENRGTAASTRKASL